MKTNSQKLTPDQQEIIENSWTFQDCTKELEEIETQIAQREGFSGNIRAQILEGVKKNTLQEDDLVRLWNQAHTIYSTWFDHHPMTMDDFKDCIVTEQMNKVTLERVEAQLAERFGLKEDVRNQLITMDKNNLLVEDELVADWHCAYSCYMDFVNNPEE